MDVRGKKPKSKLRLFFDQWVEEQEAKIEADRNDIPTCAFVSKHIQTNKNNMCTSTYAPPQDVKGVRKRIRSIAQTPCDVRSNADLEWLRTQLTGIGLLDHLSPERGCVIMQNVQLQRFRHSGMQIFDAGSPCEDLYVVLSGCVLISKQDKASTVSREVLARGVISNAAFAQGDVWAWDGCTLSKHVELLSINCHVFQTVNDTGAHAILAAQFLQKVPVFENWRYEDLLSMCTNARLRSVSKKSVVLEGEEPDQPREVFFIRRGVCEFARHRVRKEPIGTNSSCRGYQLGPCEFFGEYFMFLNTSRADSLCRYDVWCLSDADLLVIDASVLVQHASKHPRCMDLFYEEAREKVVSSGHAVAITTPGTPASPRKNIYTRPGTAALPARAKTPSASPTFPPKTPLSSKRSHLPMTSPSSRRPSTSLSCAPLPSRSGRTLPFWTESEELMAMLERGFRERRSLAEAAQKLQLAKEQDSKHTKFTSANTPLSPNGSQAYLKKYEDVPLSPHAAVTPTSASTGNAIPNHNHGNNNNNVSGGSGGAVTAKLPLLVTHKSVGMSMEKEQEESMPAVLADATLLLHCSYTKSYILATAAHLERKAAVEWKYSRV